MQEQYKQKRGKNPLARWLRLLGICCMVLIPLLLIGNMIKLRPYIECEVTHPEDSAGEGPSVRIDWTTSAGNYHRRMFLRASDGTEQPLGGGSGGDSSGRLMRVVARIVGFSKATSGTMEWSDTDLKLAIAGPHRLHDGDELKLGECIGPDGVSFDLLLAVRIYD